MTKILAMETSTDGCSAALLFDNKILNRFVVASRQHTKFIFPMIHELLDEAHLDLNQIDAIAFGCGPGSFTGVRLSASIVQGIAFAVNLPVVKISSLRAVAQAVFEEMGASKVLVAQDARMQEIYFGKYQVDVWGIMQAIEEDKLIAPGSINIAINDDFIGVGGGWKVYRDALAACCRVSLQETDSNLYPQAKYIAKLALSDFSKLLTVSVEDALPVYLREEVAWS